MINVGMPVERQTEKERERDRETERERDFELVGVYMYCIHMFEARTRCD